MRDEGTIELLAEAAATAITARDYIEPCSGRTLAMTSTAAPSFRTKSTQEVRSLIPVTNVGSPLHDSRLVPVWYPIPL